MLAVGGVRVVSRAVGQRLDDERRVLSPFQAQRAYAPYISQGVLKFDCPRSSLVLTVLRLLQRSQCLECWAVALCQHLCLTVVASWLKEGMDGRRLKTVARH